ncbi:hypothetical protein F443_01729, partial [Phytophthora nicotianae P1569]
PPLLRLLRRYRIRIVEGDKGISLDAGVFDLLTTNAAYLKQDHSKRSRDELTGVINELGPEEGSFAFLLTYKYTKHAIEGSGNRVLQGIDLARIDVLEKANNAAPADITSAAFHCKVKAAWSSIITLSMAGMNGHAKNG